MLPRIVSEACCTYHRLNLQIPPLEIAKWATCLCEFIGKLSANIDLDSLNSIEDRKLELSVEGVEVPHLSKGSSPMNKSSGHLKICQ
jgi:hypothetical protein